MLFPRTVFKELLRHLDSKEIIVLTGMRRVGKTTLLRMLFEKTESKNKVFFDLENPFERKVFEEQDYNNIWENLKQFGISKSEKAFIFLDEIQAVPEITNAIKYLFDHYGTKFFITGSSSFYLKNLFPENLAGRKIVLELFPLDFQEFLVFKGISLKQPESFSEKEKAKNRTKSEKQKKLFEEYLEFGGFPQVVIEEDFEMKKQALNDIFKSYFEKEVQKLADFKETNAFRDLMLLLLQRTGSKIDFSKLASEIGVSRVTVHSYISFLQGTYFIELVSPYSTNIDQEVSGARKVYVCDNGIASQFGKASEGSLFENAVFQNLRKFGKINYYQKRSGAEIDFLLPELKTAIEAKTRPSSQDFKKLSQTAEKLGFKKQFIISKEYSQLKGAIPATEL